MPQVWPGGVCVLLLRAQETPPRLEFWRKAMPWAVGCKASGHKSSRRGMGESAHLVLRGEARHGGGPSLAFHGEVALTV